MNGSYSKSHNQATHISAVILDLDGTLLNTEQATKDILKEFLERHGKVIDVERENKRFGMTHKETAIAIVKDYDLPLTPDQFSQSIMPLYHEKWVQAKALPGANRLIHHLHKHGVPFALASNSIRKNIEAKISHHQGWKEYFSVILGSDQVKSGKPSPDIFLEAANKMGVDAVHCLVIEDSLVGVKAAIGAGMKVVAVPSLENEFNKFSIADSVLRSLLEFHPELWGLPPFEDCRFLSRDAAFPNWMSLSNLNLMIAGVGNALPIEPIYLKGYYRNGLLHEFTDNGTSPLPIQVSGVYFGWARVGSHEMYKVVIGIKWDTDCCTSKRKIETCLIDGSNEQNFDKQMNLVLVGYIRGLGSKGNTSSDDEILDEDKLIARTSLDLPAFAQQADAPLFSEIAFEGEENGEWIRM
ncbi:hypothetical protein RJ640_018219 [Escallonia rubra]|uniref:riboflavin kinase n=1 Tax=Escallonia rubra TaxID=112253 RepID=A0AA88U823_9ASTE|nr:hypothetical protein RJ640_018219 [Escallonia rubra]